MSFLRRAGILPAVLSLCVLASPAPALTLALDPDPAWRHSGDIEALTAVLDDWLDARSGHPRKPAPAIRIVGAAEAAALRGGAARMDQVTRGLYDPDSRTILLVAPWSADKARDVSVLLHELVHHRQNGARHWVCPGAQEPEAYDLQAAWLAERGENIAVNRIAVVLEAACNRRDKHPD